LPLHDPRLLKGFNLLAGNEMNIPAKAFCCVRMAALMFGDLRSSSTVEPM
jgi:hypothetical protein